MHPATLRSEVLTLADAGVNDCEIARRLELPRTTVRDIRAPRRPPRPPCRRCWRPTRPIRFTPGEYAELLGLYLGDGCIVQAGRTQRLRLSLDSRYPRLVSAAAELVETVLPANAVGFVEADGGATTIVSAYSSHLACLFPQHGPGKKHDRPILLEPWQLALVDAAPWSLLRGLLHSDGCFFINRTGRYRYLSVEFHNLSTEILDLFEAACGRVGVRVRRYARDVRIYNRAGVADFAAFVGTKH